MNWFMGSTFAICAIVHGVEFDHGIPVSKINGLLIQNNRHTSELYMVSIDFVKKRLSTKQLAIIGQHDNNSFLDNLRKMLLTDLIFVGGNPKTGETYVAFPPDKPVGKVNFKILDTHDKNMSKIKITNIHGIHV